MGVVRNLLRFFRPSGRLFVVLGVSLLVVSTFFLIQFLNRRSASASSDWYNDDWLYRKSISFGNSGSAESDRKVKVDVDTATLISAGKMQGDCGDVRFTTLNGQALDYYLDSSGGACSTDSTDFWVRIPTVYSGETAIYVYYGDTSAENGTKANQLLQTTFTPTSGPTIASEEQSPGPVAYWKFDEGQGGTAYNFSTYTSTEPDNLLANPDFASGTEGGVANNWSTATTSVPPAGYVEVPSNALYVDPITYDATQPSKSNFFVMQYEAKYDCTGDDDGDTAATCSAPAVSGAGVDYRDLSSFNKDNVVSTANGAPIVHITQQQATNACPTGYHLITNNEWMTIARNVEAQSSNWANGTIGSTVSGGGGLKRGNVGNVDSVGYNGADPEQGTGRDTKAKLVLSNGGELWDLSGNVYEWNNDMIMGADKPHNNTGAFVEWTAFAPPGASTYGTLSYDLTRPSDSSYNANYGMGRYYEGSHTGGPYAFLRGGSWDRTSDAGVFVLYLFNTPTYQSSSFGFRCASDTVAISQSYSSTSGRSSGGGDTITIGSVADGKLYQSVNVGDTASYNISAYVKCSAGCTGGVVDNTVASLYYGGNSISNAAYEEVAGETGWYKLTGTVTGVASAVDTGVLVKAGKIVVVDDVSLYSGVLTTTLSGTLGEGTAAPMWVTEDQCISGKCLRFDGSDDVVTVSATVSGIKTVSFWVRPMTASEQLIDLNGSANIEISSGTISVAGFSSPTAYVNGVLSSTLTANAWQYVTITTESGISGSAIKIGQVGANHGQVFIDELKLYSYARTAEQVKTDYVKGAGAHGSAAVLGAADLSFLSDGLVGYWKMDEAVGATGASWTVLDSSGNGNNGTGAGDAGPSGGKFGNGGTFDGVDDSVNISKAMVSSTLTG
ncbi:MAG: DUF2341 domain-containing protein [Caldilineaceae bacterium]|nr:DUF2341 domain-containing protein [Caldilineaceae bacterium]